MSATMTARPTLYKGVQMRSRLEAGFAMWLDRCGVAWDYEPNCYANELGQYLPDFRVPEVVRCVPPGRSTGPSLPAFIEVKPSIAPHRPRSADPADPSNDLASRIRIALDCESLPHNALVVAPDGVGVVGRFSNTEGRATLIDAMWVGQNPLAIATPCVGPWLGEWWLG
jgi:hypothetical protein